MRLLVTRDGSPISHLQFKRGPIYIGRQLGSQVFLPDRSVSRQHAVIYNGKDGTWVVEDMDSSNKTFLRETAIHKSDLRDGDIIRIGQFTIEFNMYYEESNAQSIHLDDTLMPSAVDIHTVVRQHSKADSPVIKLPAKRAIDFAQATRMICTAGNLTLLHSHLLDILLRQFSAMNTWVALRNKAGDAMQRQGGRKITTELVTLTDLPAQQAISDAMSKKKYVLIPKLPKQMTNGKVRSAVIAPIIRDNDNYGILYADNSVKNESYNTADLDYLMFIAIHTAAVLEQM